MHVVRADRESAHVLCQRQSSVSVGLSGEWSPDREHQDAQANRFQELHKHCPGPPSGMVNHMIADRNAWFAKNWGPQSTISAATSIVWVCTQARQIVGRLPAVL